MPYGAAGDPENLIQPNTLEPYNPAALAVPPPPPLPMAGNGGALALPSPAAQLPPMGAAPAPNPMQTLARMLQGAHAGMLGRPNPVIEEEQKQQALDQRTQALKIQEKQFQRLMEKDEEQVKSQQKQLAVTTGLKLIDDPSPDNREWGYRMLQQHGALAPDADPAKMSLVGKLDYKKLRDDAIDFIENGLDPATMGDAFKALPLDQWKKMHAENPFALNQLRETKRSQEDVVKAFLLRARAMPPEKIAADPAIQRHIAAAESVIGAGKTPDYGNAVNTALGQIPNPATPGFGWNPKTQTIPRDVLTRAGEMAQYGSGPPTVDRDIAEIAALDADLRNPKSAEDFKATQAKRDAKMAELRDKQRAKMELQRFSRMDIENLLRKDGLKPGTPEWNTAYANIANTIPLQQGGSLIGSGNIAAGLGPQGTGMGAGAQPTPPIALGPVPPVEGATTKDIISATMTRSAAENVMESMKDPVVKGYIGQWAQHKAGLQRLAPYELGGTIPPSVVKFEKNLAMVKNYTIKLITGAQMGEREADRIQKQLPDQGNQVGEFALRMEMTMQEQQKMEKIIVTMALRGDQKAKALASDLGLIGSGGKPTVEPYAPGEDLNKIRADQSARRREIRRIGSKPDPNKKYSLNPGEALPSGWEYID